MAKTCNIKNAEPKDTYIHWPTAAPLLALVVALVASTLLIIVHYERNRTVVNVTMAPSKFDLKYKCRLCAGENTVQCGVGNADTE